MGFIAPGWAALEERDMADSGPYPLGAVSVAFDVNTGVAALGKGGSLPGLGA